MERAVRFLFKGGGGVFSKGHLAFAARPSPVTVVLAIAGIVALGYTIYASRRLGLAPFWRGTLIALRCLLLAVIFVCLMRPVVVVPSVVPQSNVVAVVLDDSASMKYDAGTGRTRLDAVKRVFAADGPLVRSLSSKFKVRFFKFSSDVEPVAGSGELRGNGTATNVANALAQSSAALAGQSIAGIVLVTDGSENAGDVGGVLNGLKARSTPVFAVGTGQQRITDVEVVSAAAPRRVLLGTLVTADLMIRASGLGPRPLTVQVTEDGRAVKTTAARTAGADGTQLVRCSFTPTSPGLHHYRFAAEPVAGELTTENNSQELLIEVEDDHPKVLYIDGEPRWEYGKIRAAMADERNVVLVSVLRSADGKFYRQGIESGDELVNGFPQSEQDLYKYDAVVLGSIEATFFKYDQLRSLEKFVSDRGGSLLALGGAKSLDFGGYGDTPMADVLPVYLSGQRPPDWESQTFKAEPSERGRDNPIVKLKDEADANSLAWNSLPPITLPEVVTALKPGAAAVLEARGTQQTGTVVPLLAEERYGRGRSLVFLASDTWRWRMLLDSSNTLFETFWRNLFRDIAGSARRQVEVSADQSYCGKGQPVHLSAEVLSARYEDVSDARVTAHVTAPSGKAFDVPLARELPPGTSSYAGTMVPDEEGIYNVQVAAIRPSVSEALPGATCHFISGPLNLEARSPAQNGDLLRKIAAETGGAYYGLASVDTLAEDISHSGAGDSILTSVDLWDMPINFILLIALVSAEWAVRKRHGLA